MANALWLFSAMARRWYKDFIFWVENTFGWTLNVVSKKQGHKGFEVLPRRWVVERTFAWFGRYRRLRKNYEIYLPLVRQCSMSP
ncbi:transposase [Synechocystis sp. PCC 6803]|uniref:Transposase n=1 Tax=Synechocystis sp. (strain ATCC 27184 / PCC 6803 / Kazusa) TaxID=1111708 RepID=P73027_SYNY3|nr:transposase [Synechocystis sp. PCC 6803]BAL28218.1 transposase [Synechocystis sp. PCC 6803 substr. GT-I]BAL31388.1 transposase [Synechocystis sp. PCC 6803 substr. PCC-N]BAL34557.1 transposase [Synechocystis sp. PCC 6803 substr. PCC-P]BAM50762.1 hypothetical protein BEST7613_1831 [Synechocystis sp. PCC 6803] [Bacillus subtilis BEST7613]